MKKWKTTKKNKVSPTGHPKSRLEIIAEEIELPDGTSTEYHYLDGSGSVMIIPVKLDEKAGEPKYVMVKQYRHPVGTNDLEFPAGTREKGESSLDAARRELKQETGYDAKQLKLLYSLFTCPPISNNQQAIYIASVEGEPSNKHAEEIEKLADIQVEELTTEQLHKKVLENEITDSQTLAALSVYLLSSQAAKKYLAQPTE